MLENGYKDIKESIVAIARRRGANSEQFPAIIGTGFFLREDGIVVTNDHVLRAAESLLQNPEDTFAEVLTVLYFHQTPQGLRVAALGVEDVLKVDYSLPPGTHYYGPKQPDVGIITLKEVCECPAVTIKSETLEEGAEIAVAGFPLGSRALTAPGWLHQIGPSLQKGIVSAALPFPCPTPHGYLLDVAVQGGSSGSPVFDPETGTVSGIIYAGLLDFYSNTEGNQYKVPTNLTLAVPGWYLARVLERLDEEEILVERRKAKTPLNKWMENHPKNVQMRPHSPFDSGS